MSVKMYTYISSMVIYKNLYKNFFGIQQPLVAQKKSLMKKFGFAFFGLQTRKTKTQQRNNQQL